MRIIKLLKTFNLFLSVVIVLFVSYILLHPFIPDLVFAVSSDKFAGYAYQSKVAAQNIGQIEQQLPKIPADNRLVIPTILVNAPISEGDDSSALNSGMWRRPNTSTPDLGSNTVIVGHRVLYTSGPDTLYQLDKVKVDDLILVYWRGKEYDYKVYDISIVNPDHTEIEDSTIDPILTLYTCTPRWTSLQRLVVKARLQQ